jgi:hypothetical protein
MKKDVLIGFPVYDARPELACLQTILACVDNPNSCVAQVQYCIGDSLVTRARNKIVAEFMQTEYEYLMFIDSDIKFSMKDINTLRAHDKDIIGGVYLKKKIPYEPVANSVIGNEGELLLMKEAGTGFLLIHRRVFEKISEQYPDGFYKHDDDEKELPYYDYFRVGVVNGRYLSEDYYFCHLARECGFSIHYDPQVFTWHIGKAMFPFNDMDLLVASADLLDKYNLKAELDKDILDLIQEGINKQKKARGYED